MDGFVAETTAASVIFTASHWGIPISTTHCVTSTIFGVGVADPKQKIQWVTIRKMLITWVITLPASAAVAAATYWLLHFVI
jgi:PiT family inorganic phosphate transporter